MAGEPTPMSDKELWQRLSVRPASAHALVSDMELAAWLEGRLSDVEAAGIEAAIAADPELRRTVLEMRDALAGPLPAASERLLVRARALVGFATDRQAPRAWSFGRPYRALRRMAMAMTVLAIAGSGFVVGGGLGESFAQQRYETSAATSSEMSEFFTPDGV